MLKPITFTEQEIRNLLETFTEIRMDAQQRQYYEPVVQPIIDKMNVGNPVTFTEQESRAIESLYQHFRNLCKNWQPLLSGREFTFGQDTRQLNLVQDILSKVEEAS